MRHHRITLVGFFKKTKEGSRGPTVVVRLPSPPVGILAGHRRTPAAHSDPEKRASFRSIKPAIAGSRSVGSTQPGILTHLLEEAQQERIFLGRSGVCQITGLAVDLPRLGGISGRGPVRRRADELVHVPVGEGDARAQRHGDHTTAEGTVGGSQDHLAQRLLVAGQIGRAGEPERAAAGVIESRDRTGVAGKSQAVTGLPPGNNFHRCRRQGDGRPPEDLQAGIHCHLVRSDRLVGHLRRSRGQLQGQGRRLTHHHRADRLAEVPGSILHLVGQGVGPHHRGVDGAGHKNVVREQAIRRIQSRGTRIGEDVPNVKTDGGRAIQGDHREGGVEHHGQLKGHRGRRIIQFVSRLGGGDPNRAGGQEPQGTSLHRRHGRSRGSVDRRETGGCAGIQHNRGGGGIS